MTQELHCHGVKQGGGDSQMSTILYFYVVNLSTKGAGEARGRVSKINPQNHVNVVYGCPLIKVLLNSDTL